MQAAIEESVPADVLSAFLYARFRSRQDHTFVDKMLSAMRGDATLFTRHDGVEAQWRLITPIEEAWAMDQTATLPGYPAGSDGPAEADGLLARNGHKWRPIGAALDHCDI